MNTQEPQNSQLTTMDKIVFFIEKWALLFLVLIAYLFLSAKPILFLIYPPKMECGMPFLGAIMAQTFFTVVAAIIATLIFYFRKDHRRSTKWITFLVILAPLTIAYALF